jgi:hypothetical protein
MTLIKIGSLTINMDHVTHWDVVPREEYGKPTPPAGPVIYHRIFEPTDDPVVIIHFVGIEKGLMLWTRPALAFLKAVGQYPIRDAHLEPAPAASGSAG